MNIERELRFAPATVEGFLTALEPLWASGLEETWLVGDNQLSVEIEKALLERNIPVARGSLSNGRISKQPKLIAFTETDGEKLGAQLMACADMVDIVAVAPVTDWHFSQKPLFLISIPKAGTHLLYELAAAIGYRSGVELPEFPQAQTWYCVEYSNSHTVAKDFFVDTVRRAPFGNRHHPFPQSPALFIYRHPLDILVSEAHYYQREGKTVFAGYLNERDFDARVARLMQDKWLLGSLRDRVGGFLPWLEFPNVIPLSFEELVGASGGGDDHAQIDLIWSILLKLQAPGIAANIARQVFNRNAATFREGQIGGYTKQLSHDVIAKFAAENADILRQFGYPEDGTPALPRVVGERRRKAIHYAHFNHESIPLTIESGFLGCNLVRYQHQVFAIPMAAGPIALGKLQPEALSSLPAASTVDALKSLLLIGKSDLANRMNALNQLAETLREERPPQTFCGYWADPAAPSVVEEYQGFNLVTWYGQYVGLRQTIGPVDLSNDLGELAQRHNPGDVLISPSLVELRNDINLLSIVGAATDAIEDVAKRIDAAQLTDDARLQAADQRLQLLQDEVEMASRRASEWKSAFDDRHSATMQHLQELRQQQHDADDRADKSEDDFKAMQEQLAAVQADAGEKHAITAQHMQQLRQQLHVAGERVHETERTLTVLQTQFDVARIEADTQRSVVERNMHDVRQQVASARERIAESNDGLQNLRERLDAARVEVREKQQAALDQVQELGARLQHMGQRADETDRLFNELLKYFDGGRAEADARHRIAVERIQELHARSDEADRRFSELLKRFDDELVRATGRDQATQSQISSLSQQAESANARADASDQRFRESHERFLAFLADVLAERERVQAKLNDLQQQSDTLSRNLFVRIGRRIGRLFNRESTHG